VPVGAEHVAAIASFDALLQRRRELQENSRLENSLADFFREAWRVLEPETSLSWSWHFEYLSEWLMMISSGEFKHRYPEKLGIIFNCPPRGGKSSLVTITWPVWDWINHPTRRFLCASYSGPLANDHNIKRQRLVDSGWFQSRWGTRFHWGVRKQVEHCENNRTGAFVATSVDGRSTGFGGDFDIGDDLLKATDAYSEPARETTNAWIDSSFTTQRLNNPVTGAFVHISQRLADSDPTGHLLERYPNKFVHIVIKREAEEDEVYEFPISARVYHRPKGDVLDAERCPPQVLAELKRNSREWAGQQQQQPAPSSGIIFQPDWWHYYRSSDRLPNFDQVAISVDCAFKSAAHNDYVSIQKWGAVGPRSYLLDCNTEHLGYTATKVAIKAMNAHGRRASVILIEDKANGSAVVEELRREDLGASVIAVNPEGGKESRAYAASADCEAGNVFLPEDAPWLSELLHIAAHFPAVKHDDCVDAMTQFLNWRRTKMLRLPLLDYYERQQAQALGLAEVLRCEWTDELGRTMILEWDDLRHLWVDPKTDATYPPGDEEAEGRG